MCTTFTLSIDRLVSSLATWHDFGEDQVKGSLLVKPKDTVPLLVKSDDNHSFGIMTMAWGFQLIPDYQMVQHDSPLTGKYINARWENLSLASIWKESYAKRRAVIPVRSFHHRDTKFALSDSPVMYVAAVYEIYPYRRFAVVSRPSYSPVSHYHPRSPMLLTEDGIKIWLDRNLSDNLLDTFTTFAALHYKPKISVLH